MIDTDKYEGHTPAPWMNLGSDANSLLMQDAPLLLAEVKRLHYWDEEMDKVIATLDEHNWAPSDGDVHEIVTHLLTEVKRLREENRELEEFLNGSHHANQSYIRRLLRAQKWAYKQVLHNDSLMMDYDDYVWGEEE